MHLPTYVHVPTKATSSNNLPDQLNGQDGSHGVKFILKTDEITVIQVLSNHKCGGKLIADKPGVG